MSTDYNPDIARLRLLHILSPALPVGSYSYSQGMEWAVQAGWLNNQYDLSRWIEEQINGQLAKQDLPLLARLYDASVSNDKGAFLHWSQAVLAWRDSVELRQEEKDRATAFLRILHALPEALDNLPEKAMRNTQLAGLAWVSNHWHIRKQDLLSAYAHNWMESAIVAGVKLIPLGQSAGQNIQYSLIPLLPGAVREAQQVTDDEIGYSAPAISYASCAHEILYTRIYRS